MSLFPTIIAGDTLESLDELVKMLDYRGRNNITDNPAQLAPAEGLIKDRRDPKKAEAMAEACAILLKDSDNPGVLQLCAHLGASNHPVFYKALVERLESGPPVPDAPGMAEATLIRELANTFASKSFGQDKALHKRGVDALLKRNLLAAAVFVVSSSDPNKVAADLLIKVLGAAADPSLSTPIGLLVYALASSQPDRLLDIARALAGSAPELRALGVKRAEQGNRSWWSKNGPAFKAAAGVP